VKPVHLCILLALFFSLGCSKSELLDDDELEYVHLTVALAKAKAVAKDSAQHRHLRDSLFNAFGTTKAAYTAKTESFTEEPERTAIIFRAIGDSLKIR
jgi:hypothetical protein